MATISWTGVRGLGPFKAFCDRIGDGAYRRIVRQEGVPEALLADPEAKIPLEKMFALLDGATRAAGDPLFGLRLGGEIAPGDYGTWARYVTAGRSLEEMTRRVARGIGFYQPGAAFSVERCGGIVIWRYHSAPAQGPGEAPHQDHLIGPMIRTVRLYCGPRWLPSWIELSYPRLPHAEALAEAVGVPVRFEAPALGLAFPASDLARASLAPAPLAGLVTFSDLRDVVRGMPPRTVADGVRHVLRATSREANADLALLTLEDVAQLLGRSSRSLQRDLNRDGAGFRDILNAVRIARARELIAGTDAPLQEIAWHLGYSELPHFTRAFREQVGVTPGRFRNMAARMGSAASAGTA